MSNCKVIVIHPDCEICGKRMDRRFLQIWNEKRACTQCIEELTADVYDYALS